MLTPWVALDVTPTFAELAAEAQTAADVDPGARHDLAYLTPELIADAAIAQANLAAQEAEATRPLTPDEQATFRAIVDAERRRLGRETLAETLDVIDPLSDGRASVATPTGSAAFPEPEDRGTATLSALGEVEYVDDLIRPGRIVVVAAEEGAGKSYAIGGELAIRVAVAGGSFAGTWPVLRTGPVLYMSEMHADDDYGREAIVLASLELERSALVGRYYRLPLMTAAGGRPALTVPEWRAWVTGWLRDHGALLLIVDTATGATQVDPWGREIQAVYAALRVMLAEYPELAIVLLIHLKKPAGRGERRISDVLGEWGRWCDVVVILENDGNGLIRARLTVRKRVRHERRILVTKTGGLLVDPQDLDETKGTKVPAEKVLAAIAGAPGITYVELGTALGVSKDTASNYVKALGDRLDTVKGTARSGPEARVRVYAITESPNIAEQARFGDPSAMGAAIGRERSPNAESPYIDRRSASAISLAARLPIEEPEHRTSEHDQRFDVSDRTPSDGDGSVELADLLVEEDYPRSAWDPNAGDDDPDTEGLLAATDAGGAP
ncbi:MAG TPA: AAA family ATPase [Candidatus Limnocylindrales bacterium]